MCGCRCRYRAAGAANLLNARDRCPLGSAPLWMGRGARGSAPGRAVVAGHLDRGVDFFRGQQDGGLDVYPAAGGHEQRDAGRGDVVRQVHDRDHVRFAEGVVERVELSPDAGARLFDGGPAGRAALLAESLDPVADIGRLDEVLRHEFPPWSRMPCGCCSGHGGSAATAATYRIRLPRKPGGPTCRGAVRNRRSPSQPAQPLTMQLNARISADPDAESPPKPRLLDYGFGDLFPEVC